METIYSKKNHQEINTSVSFKSSEFKESVMKESAEKFALISLLGYMVNSMKKKKPGVTYYEVTAKLAEKTGLDEDTIQTIAIITEDFSYGCTDFPTFGVQPKDMPTKIRELMGKFFPF